MTPSYSDSDPVPADGASHPTALRDTWLHHLLDTLGWPALLLDAERAVVAANPAAGRLRRDTLVTSGGRLRCEDAASDERLAQGVRELLGDGGARSSARRRRRTLSVMNLARDRIVFVTVARLELAPAAQASSSDPLALVTVHDPQTPLRLHTDGLADLFALTPAELRVAEVLADGQSPAAAAQLLSLSEGTVRTHLRTIFKKTGTHRQAELVRLLTRFWYP
ncbi:MAG TPA: helix-turn-helix transcriptional regulator [Burkholderiaceae bacterium]|nr:helix-turn-helix transcriptional regulator [Burkholderiaceae bacterium]